MQRRKFLLGSSMAIALLLGGCGERQANPVRSRRSRASEYRAGLDAYVAGRTIYAFEHFRAAAELGHVNAQYYTGLMYANGEGTKQDYREAAKWYHKAAANNQPDALLQLARLYVVGLGVERDSRMAIQLFERAAKAYPPGEKKDQATEQMKALAAVSQAT
jgi:TPR repeat protein